MLEFKDFCEKLGSTSPTPGGGAAAGLSLSMGCACIEKAVRFSNIKNYNEVIDKILKIKENGYKLSEDDQTAFSAWQEARKLPKDTAELKEDRDAKIKKYSAMCARVPLMICENSLDLIKLTDDFLPDCNKWLISDAGIGALFANTAFESGIFNININKPFLKDDALLKQIAEFEVAKITEFTKLYNKILEYCKQELG